MSTPAVPDRETARVAALRRYEILDTLPEEEFDEFAQLATQLCGMPIALVSFADRGRLWVKNRVGIEISEVPAGIAFCSYAMRGEGILEVPDALLDERFRDSPLVTGEPYIRSYAGAPIRTPEGLAVGALCLIDRVPRVLTDEQRRNLASLCRRLERQLELRAATRDLARLKHDVEVRPTNTLDAITDGFWDWNVLTGEVYYSPRWAALLGHAWEDVPQRVEFFLQLVHPDDSEAVGKAVAEHLAGRSLVKELQVRLRTKSGEYLLVHDRGQVVARDAEGNATRMVGTITDITEKTRAANALQVSAERLQLATSAAEIAIWDFLPDENLLIWDEGMFRLHRVDPASFKGRLESWLNCLHPDDRDRVVPDLQEALAGKLFDTRYRIVWPDGEIRYVEARAVTLAESDKAPRRMIGVNRDVTERVRAEAEALDREARLRDSQFALEEAQRAARLGSWECDSESGCISWSREMYRILQAPEEHAGQLFDLMMSRTHPADAATLLAAHEALVNSGEEMDLECRLLMPDGSTRVVWSRGVATDSRRGKATVRGTLQDVTERKQLEARLSQASKMESVGRLAGGVAHDFNNLLTVINGYAQILLDKPELAQSLREHVRMIVQAGEQAAGLTQQLLAFSRNQRLQPSVIDLNEVIAKLYPMLIRLVSERIEVQFVPYKHAARVNADPHQMGQVVLNLVGNARDAMPSGGTIRLEISSGQLAGQAQIELSVSDTGVGMDCDTVRKIFDPFFTTKDIGRGTGLGLAMVHGIVTQSGGQISVDSQPDKGTSFRIWLPESTSTGEKAGDALSPQVRNPGKVVLVVEDRPDVRGYAALALEAGGFRPLTASSGAEALTLWATQGTRIDLVLTDLVMPGMTGRELADELRKLTPGVKVLFMSGYPDEIAGFEGSTPEHEQLIAKPFLPQERAARIAGIL